MSNKLQPVRGTKDILPDDYRQFKMIVDKARQVSENFGYEEMSTPIFEFTEIFIKTLGQDSDVVGKEMYSFQDKSDNNLTLRPEFTAGIARSFISNGLQQKLPAKFFSFGPLFRYERPQKGRQRQFHQINFENLGVASSMADVEIISLGNLILSQLDILDKIKLEINSIGDTETRSNYKKALVKYFSKYQNDISEDSQRRLISNPMRILDSKDKKDKEIAQNAPKLEEYYSSNAMEFFDQVQEGLTLLGIKYHINPKLVRGLDYYNHTAFEFTTDQLGAQNAVLAGGRYDNLIKSMGGPETPSVGFAGGIERLVELSAQKAAKKRPICLIPIGQEAESEAQKLAFFLRSSNYYIELSHSGNLGKRMKHANKFSARAAVIFGEDELKNNIVKIKDFDSGQETEISTQQLIDKLNIYR